MHLALVAGLLGGWALNSTLAQSNGCLLQASPSEDDTAGLRNAAGERIQLSQARESLTRHVLLTVREGNWRGS